MESSDRERYKKVFRKGPLSSDRTDPDLELLL